MNYLLVGRPNVGKSSIFNNISIYNSNIVHSEAGTTRDWHKERIKNTDSYIFDTPGVFINKKKNDLNINFFSNTKLLTQINSFFYVIDYKSGYNENDQFGINLIIELILTFE